MDGATIVICISLAMLAIAGIAKLCEVASQDDGCNRRWTNFCLCNKCKRRRGSWC